MFVTLLIWRGNATWSDDGLETCRRLCNWLAKEKRRKFESCLVVLRCTVPRGNSQPDLILTTRLVSDSFAFDRRTIISADLCIQHRVSMDIKIQRRLLDLYASHCFLAFCLYGIKCFLFYSILRTYLGIILDVNLHLRYSLGDIFLM